MADNEDETIQCPIGKWYFKRMTMLGLLLIGFGCWFLYDAVIGYPKGAFKAIAYEAFKAGPKSTWEEYSTNGKMHFSEVELDEVQLAAVKQAHEEGGKRNTWTDFARKKKFDDLSEPAPGSEHRPVFEAFLAGGRVASLDVVEAAWISYAGANNLPVDPVAAENDQAIEAKNAFRDASKPRDWALYAAANDLPSKEPHFHGKTDIGEQYFFGGLCAASGLFVLVLMLLNRNRSITADALAYYPKPSVKIPYSHIFKVDTRKWRRKGLAYAFHRSGEGEEKKAIIDDLKFVGAQKILDRILKNLKEGSEVIEEEADEEDNEGEIAVTKTTEEVGEKEG